MIEFETEDREKVMILIHAVQSFEKIDENKTLIVLSHGVEYVVHSKYNEIKNILLDFYTVDDEHNSQPIDSTTSEVSEEYLSSTYTQQEVSNYKK